jgi:Cu/Ag efflux pump CusA
VAVVGGLLFSTLLTVLVVPVVYSYLSGRRERAAEEDAVSEQAASAARA